MKSYFKIYLIAFIILISCSSTKKIADSSLSECYEKEAKVSSYKIERRKEILFREVCYANDVSFCSDGGDQYYRLSPLLIEYKDSNKLSNVYLNNEVYDVNFMLLDEKFIDQHDLNNIKLDSLNAELLNSKILGTKSFESNYLRRAYSKRVRFNGEFMLDIIKMEFDCVYVGKKCIYIPKMEIDKSNKEKKIESVLVDYYIITNIY